MNKKGMSLIEILIACGVIGIIMSAMLAMQQNQSQANNYLEFQLKRIQLQNALIGQVLNDPNNCACLFSGSTAIPSSPPAPGATLAGINPTQIGRYQIATPGSCAGATIPQPLIDSVGIDGMKATSIKLTKIMNISGVYSGEFSVDLESTKSVLGPKQLPIRIPVSISTSPVGANVNFVSCTASSSTPKLPLVEVSGTFVCPPTGSLGKNSTPCPAGTIARSCGWEDNNPSPDEDTFSCYLDIPNNSCNFTRDRSHNCDNSMVSFCYCEPL